MHTILLIALQSAPITATPSSPSNDNRLLVARAVIPTVFGGHGGDGGPGLLPGTTGGRGGDGDGPFIEVPPNAPSPYIGVLAGGFGGRGADGNPPGKGGVGENAVELPRSLRR